jgi:aryl-alcohol dehydrogenase-like predicted oxidoreductase
MVPHYTYKAYDSSESYIRASCEQSLKRLNTDYIDLYQVHRIDYLTHPEETAQALEQLQREGKIRHAGVSNYSLPEIRALATYMRLESLQTPFNLLELEPLEVGYQAVCLEKNMTLLAYRPLARAALTGTKEFSHSDWKRQRDAGVVAQLRRFADEYNVTPGQLSLAWLLQMPGGIIPLVGTANDAHIREAAGAAGVRLARDDWYEMLVIGRGRPMPWGQRPYFYLKDK